MQPTQSTAIASYQLFKERNGRGIVALNEHLLHGVALPAARAVEGRDQLRSSESIQSRNGAWLLTRWIHPVNAPFVLAGPQIEPLLPVARDPFGMLDHLPIHIRDPQSTVGSGLNRRWAKPVVA